MRVAGFGAAALVAIPWKVSMHWVGGVGEGRGLRRARNGSGVSAPLYEPPPPPVAQASRRRGPVSAVFQGSEERLRQKRLGRVPPTLPGEPQGPGKIFG